MNKSDFSYHLPPQLVAQYPCARRSASRLLHVGRDKLEDLQFDQLDGLLHPGDLLIFNDTAVIAARLQTHKASGARVEVLLNEQLDEHQAWALLKSAGPIRLDTSLHCADGSRLVVRRRRHDMFLLESPDRSWTTLIEEHGMVPLPPYMHRPAEPLNGSVGKCHS